MRLWVLGSGSRGNAVLVQHGSACVLVDAGFGPRTLCSRLALAGVAPQDVMALVLTHEHLDHVRGARALATRFGWPVYATRGTHAALPGLSGCLRAVIERTTPAMVGGMMIEAWGVSHDAAEPVVFFITAHDNGERAVVAHDLGRVSAALAEAFTHVDILVLESNHDEGMLRAGPYPPSLQRRIAGPHGHLSNREAGAVIREAVARRARHVVLAHLSEANNAPEVALGTVRRFLVGSRFRGTLVAAPQDAVCGPLGSA